MKSKSILIIGLLILFISVSLSQTWRSEIDLNLSADYGDGSDLFTNRNGNHVLLHLGDQIKYYLFSYNGTQIRTSTVVSLN